MRGTLSLTGLALLTALAVTVAVPAPVYTHKPITTNILFKNEIAQIFQRKCFQCHSENNLSVPLTTYTEARPWARAIREEVLERQMPPWQAVQGYGRFSNDVSLNGREREIILAWADGGAPSGVPRSEESIPPIPVATVPEWEHGTPDIVLPIGAGERVGSGEKFSLRRIVVNTKLPRATQIHALSLKQGDRRVVRHAAFYDAHGRWLGGWAPWHTVSELAGETTIALPANARITVELGYSGAEEDVTDRSELGLYLAKAAAGSQAGWLQVPAATTALGAEAAPARVRSQLTLAQDARVVALWPEVSEGARSVEITATSPDGVLSPLLWIKEYRPEWRSAYYLPKPLALSKGTRLTLTSYFDSPDNTPRTARASATVLTAIAPVRPAPVRRK